MLKFKSYQIYVIKLFVFVIIIMTYIVVPSINNFINTIIKYFIMHDYYGLRIEILKYGTLAPVIIMALQSVIPIVPGLIITLTNSWLFGWVYGAIYSCIGSLLSAIIDFIIARHIGKPFLTLSTFKKNKFTKFTNIELLLEKYGLFFVFISRLIPIIPFKIISYSAGLTSMSIIKFSIVTLLGQIPAIFLYSYIGYDINKCLIVTLFIMVMVIIIIIYSYYKKIYIQSIIKKYYKFKKEHG